MLSSYFVTKMPFWNWLQQRETLCLHCLIFLEPIGFRGEGRKTYFFPSGCWYSSVDGLSTLLSTIQSKSSFLSPAWATIHSVGCIVIWYEKPVVIMQGVFNRWIADRGCDCSLWYGHWQTRYPAGRSLRLSQEFGSILSGEWSLRQRWFAISMLVVLHKGRLRKGWLLYRRVNNCEHIVALRNLDWTAECFSSICIALQSADGWSV